MLKSLSSRLRDLAIQGRVLDRDARSLLFEAADALESREPTPSRAVVKEIGVS